MSEQAAHVAAVLREVADAPLESPLDPMTWRAAMLAAARIVEEDDALRVAATELCPVCGAEVTSRRTDTERVPVRPGYADRVVPGYTATTYYPCGHKV